MSYHVIVARRIQDAAAEMRRLELDRLNTVCLSTDDGNANLRIGTLLIDPTRLHLIGAWQKGPHARKLMAKIAERILRFEIKAQKAER
jgi:hypothetical protein